MDDVVALKASTEDGSYVFFMTFGGASRFSGV